MKDKHEKLGQILWGFSTTSGQNCQTVDQRVENSWEELKWKLIISNQEMWRLAWHQSNFGAQQDKGGQIFNPKQLILGPNNQKAVKTYREKELLTWIICDGSVAQREKWRTDWMAIACCPINLPIYWMQISVSWYILLPLHWIANISFCWCIWSGGNCLLPNKFSNISDALSIADICDCHRIGLAIDCQYICQYICSLIFMISWQLLVAQSISQ